MPPPYQPIHWNVFSAIPDMAQGPVGLPPAAWAQRYHIAALPGWPALPNHQLNRQAVRAICQNPAIPVLYGYVCAMAWGGQGGGPGGAGHAAAAWNAHAAIAPHLTALRHGGLSRSAAYALFLNAPVPGLGPSFFTKLLYFFNPLPNCYIMDQWTGKSVNLLTNTKVVRMLENAPSDQNQEGNYQAFCEEVDLMAGLLGCTGEVAEERLFSQGGHHPWPWRAYVKNHWPLRPPLPRYAAVAMHAIYPHIPLNCF